jgi:tRNA threonylcarbamoyladenosine biosynthesis protein TsaB
MIILGIDTSSSLCSAGLADGEQKVILIGQCSVNLRHAHSEKIMTLIDHLLQESGIGKKEINAIAVSIGPGSFTGLRIGLSVAKGLSFALDVPVVGVPTLDILSEKIKFLDEKVDVAITSRKNEFYHGSYLRGVRQSECTIATTDEIISKPISILITDTPEAFKDKFSRPVIILEREFAFPDILCLMKLGYQKILDHDFESGDSLVPLYVQSFKGVM